jgi:hypothetical protein
MATETDAAPAAGEDADTDVCCPVLINRCPVIFRASNFIKIKEMKNLILIIFTLGLFYGSASAEFSKIPLKNTQDTTARKDFIDENENGIDDRDENGQGKCYKGRRGDRFVDKDGDGICDEREAHIGLKRRHRGGRNGNK